MWTKEKKVNTISCEESNILCSICLKKMNTLHFENLQITICHNCGDFIVDESKFNDVIKYFLINGKIF